MSVASPPTHVASEAGFVALQAVREVNDDGLVSKLSGEYAGTVAGMRAVFDSGRTRDLSWRRKQLEGLVKGYQQNHEAIRIAIGADLGGPSIRALFDMIPTVDEANHAIANLDSWAAPKKAAADWQDMVQSSFVVRPEPKGVTLNIAPWNFPFTMCFQPLVAALAAGNCMVIKPSEMAPHCADVIEKIVKEHLDQDCIKVVKGAVAETTALLEQRWDHIFYTGNGAVGRIVMHAAAKHITPVTLELGGKSPVIVDKTANMTTVVNRVFQSKTMNTGQVCIAPDYVLIDETRSEEFFAAFSKQVQASNVGVGSKSNPEWGKIINERHALRLKRLIDTSGGEVVCGGSADVDVAEQHVPMTVIKGVSQDAPIMQEEIFGPVLPVIAIKNMDEGLRIIKERERPLALYIFSQDKAFQERVLAECPSGGAAVNTAVEQVTNKNAKFGGTGASGIGGYHGKYGFDEFSHFRTILTKSGSSPQMPHPESIRPWMYDLFLKAKVTGFVSPETEHKVKMAGKAAATVAAAVFLHSRL